MKKTILIFIVAFILLVNLKSNAQWVQMPNGMGTDKTIHSLATLGNNIFAGTDNGVYLFTNISTIWSQVGLNGKSVYSLATPGNNIFAGTDNGVYLSTDNCTTWTQTALNNQYVLSLAVNGNNILAGTSGNGVYLSTNNGTSWTQSSLNNETVYSFAVSGNNIFAGTNNYPIGSGGVYLSTNNSTTWTQTTLNNNTIWSLTILSNNIFAGTGSIGVYLSTDNGAGWSQVGLNGKSAYSFATLGNNIFAGTDNGVYLSTNNGTSWLNKNQGFNVNPSVAALLLANNYIFAGTSGYSVWRRSYTEIIDIKQISELIPAVYSLQQNYPNPFNPSTKIQYAIPKNGFVRFVVFDALGREVKTLVNEYQSPGTYETTFIASKYSSGVYYYRLTTRDFAETKRMLLLK